MKTNYILKQSLKISFGAILAISSQMIPLTAQADILNLAPHAKVLTKANVPKHGDKMKNVSKKFGVAKLIKISKGKVTKRNPKITRWDYAGFSVYFENSHVIHSVIHN